MGPPLKNVSKSSAATTPKSNTPAKPAKTSSSSTNASAEPANIDTSTKKKTGGGRPRKDKENLPSNPDRNDVTSTSGATNRVDVAKENRILREQLSEIQAEVNQLKAAKAADPEPEEAVSIKAIPRPKGEAGDRKRGFILIEAMELNKGVKNQTLYNSILDTVRKNIARANLDLSVNFRCQDVEKISQVFRMTRKKQPYMDRKRFPADWATAKIIKQYLRGQRKTKKRKRRALSDDDQDDEDIDDEDDEEGEVGVGAGSGTDNEGVGVGANDEEQGSDEDLPAPPKCRRVEVASD